MRPFSGVSLMVTMVLAGGGGRVDAQSLDVFPPLPAVHNKADATTVSTDYSASGSAWALPFGEDQVFLARLSNVPAAGSAGWPWDVRFGKGGQIYSIRSNFGEAIPPQWRANPARRAPWIDEVFQVVAVPSKLNTPENPFFIHQAGVYLIDPILKGPFFSPTLHAAASDDGRSFSTLTWGQISGAQPDSPHRSRLLIYQRTTHLGEGVLCVDNVLFSFGDETFDDLGLPWGGTRATNLGTHLLALPDGSLQKDDVLFKDGALKQMSETAGWMAFASGQSDESAALSLVFGTQEGDLWRYGFARQGERDGAGEAEWRNYLVGAAVRREVLKPGTTLSSRYFLIIGTIANAKRQIESRKLVTQAGVQLAPRSLTDQTRWTSIAVDARNQSIQPTDRPADGVGYLLAEPIDYAMPLFELTLASGGRVYSLDPYAVSAKPYDGQVKSFRLVGFVPARSTLSASQQAQSRSLNDVLSSLGPSFVKTSDDVVVPTSLVK